LSSQKEFRKLYNNSKKFHTQFFVLFYHDDNNRRFSVIASKKIGNAVKRNFAKRRLRALFIEVADKVQGSFVLVAKPDIVDVSFEKLRYLFKKSLKKVLS